MGRVWVYVLTLVATVFCAAVNAYTLQVMYPAWRVLDAQNFAALHRDYLERLWPVITLPHVVMFFASAALIVLRPWFVSRSEAIAVFALDAGVVVVSAFLAGPIHTRFEQQGCGRCSRAPCVDYDQRGAGGDDGGGLLGAMCSHIAAAFEVERRGLLSRRRRM